MQSMSKVSGAYSCDSKGRIKTQRKEAPETNFYFKLERHCQQLELSSNGVSLPWK